MERELRRFRQLRRSWYIFFFQILWRPEPGDPVPEAGDIVVERIADPAVRA